MEPVIIVKTYRFKTYSELLDILAANEGICPSQYVAPTDPCPRSCGSAGFVEFTVRQ